MSVQNSQSNLLGQRQSRINKIEGLKQLGVDPYPSKAKRTHMNSSISDDFDSLQGQEVTVVGRVMTWRQHGEVQFIDLQDTSGRVQIYILNSELPEKTSGQNIGLDDLELLDANDFVQITGEVTKTQRGEISVLAKQIQILSKSIRPLPSKTGSMTDKEARYRRRYLDMTMNVEVREMFERRAKYWDEVRKFMNSQGFHEVNIPVLEHTTGGADAKPFETHYDALSEDFYLRISHELPLKRLIGAGFEKVYDIGPRFRNEGFSDEHLPEHIAMEWYWAYADWRDGMEFTRKLFIEPLKATYGTTKFQMLGQEVELDQEWVEYDFTDLIQEKFGVNVLDDDLEVLFDKYVVLGGDKGIVKNRSRVADSLWKMIRKTMAGPAFLTGIPKFLSPLSKQMPDDPRKTERFHPILNGSEAANAFTELNDPIEQLARFVEQQELKEGGDDEAHMMDIDFVEMLEYGLPPTVGYGHSERVFWMMEGVTAREGVPFPPMKRSFENLTRAIYGDVYDFDAAIEHGKKSNSNFNSQRVVDTEDSGVSNEKMVLVLDKELEGWRLTNTIGHLTAYLGNQSGKNLLRQDKFKLTDDDSLNSNIWMPIVSLSAKQAQLHNLWKACEEAGVTMLVYTADMIDFNNDEELKVSYAQKSREDLKIEGIGLFGDVEELNKLTKKFSLWK